MEIANVTIVVRGTRGEVKKSVFDGTGKLLRGDAHEVLEDNTWRPNFQPAPPPLDPDNLPEPSPEPADDGVDDLDIDEMSDVDDVPEE